MVCELQLGLSKVLNYLHVRSRARDEKKPRGTHGLNDGRSAFPTRRFSAVHNVGLEETSYLK